MSHFLVVSIVINGFLAMVWQRKTWLNLLLKVFFFGMTLWAFGLYMKNF
jgi:hypothetical protein